MDSSSSKLNKSISLPDIFSECENNRDENTITIKTSFVQEFFHGNELKGVVKCKSYQELYGTLKPNNTFKMLENSKNPNVLKNEASKKNPSLGRKLKIVNNALKVTRPKNLKEKKYFYSFINFFIIAALFFAILAFHIFDSGISYQSYVDIEHDLNSKIIGQRSALNNLTNSLEYFIKNESPGIVLGCLTGSSGVGKSYVINIIKKHIYPSIFCYEPKQLDIIDDDYLYGRISKYRKQLLIFDNLTVNDIQKLLSAIEKLKKGNFENLYLLLSFSTQEVDDNLKFSIIETYSDKIKEQLEKLDLKLYFSKFNTLKEGDLRLWLTNQLTVRNVDKHLFEGIINDLLKDTDIEYQGMKGLSSKLSLKVGDLLTA